LPEKVLCATKACRLECGGPFSYGDFVKSRCSFSRVSKREARAGGEKTETPEKLGYLFCVTCWTNGNEVYDVKFEKQRKNWREARPGIKFPGGVRLPSALTSFPEFDLVDM